MDFTMQRLRVAARTRQYGLRTRARSPDMPVFVVIHYVDDGRNAEQR